MDPQMNRKLNVCVLAVLPIGCGIVLGWMLVFTAFQTFTLSTSLLLFAHWASDHIGREGIPLLSRALPGSIVSVAFVACVWLSFFCNPTGGLTLMPAMGQEIVSFPRPISVIVTCLPETPYFVYVLGELVWNRPE